LACGEDGFPIKEARHDLPVESLMELGRVQPMPFTDTTAYEPGMFSSQGLTEVKCSDHPAWGHMRDMLLAVSDTWEDSKTLRQVVSGALTQGAASFIGAPLVGHCAALYTFGVPGALASAGARMLFSKTTVAKDLTVEAVVRKRLPFHATWVSAPSSLSYGFPWGRALALGYGGASSGWPLAAIRVLDRHYIRELGLDRPEALDIAREWAEGATKFTRAMNYIAYTGRPCDWAAQDTTPWAIRPLLEQLGVYGATRSVATSLDQIGRERAAREVLGYRLAGARELIRRGTFDPLNMGAGVRYAHTVLSTIPVAYDVTKLSFAGYAHSTAVTAAKSSAAFSAATAVGTALGMAFATLLNASPTTVGLTIRAPMTESRGAAVAARAGAGDVKCGAPQLAKLDIRTPGSLIMWAADYGMAESSLLVIDESHEVNAGNDALEEYAAMCGIPVIKLTATPDGIPFSPGGVKTRHAVRIEQITASDGALDGIPAPRGDRLHFTATKEKGQKLLELYRGAYSVLRRRPLPRP
jgi:hypothetical protein